MALLILGCVFCQAWTAPAAASEGTLLAQLPPPSPAAESPAPAVPDQEQPDVLTSGPVHEAFAEPVSLQAEAGVTTAQQPPPAIDETPPAERPQGQNVVWVPGYWSWDAQRNGFLWVTGCWRIAPPNMAWMPGYWTQDGAQWEWVAGFWRPAGSQEIEYLPAPPALPDVPAAAAPPSADTIWVPPCWYWRDGRYVLRAGYRVAAQGGWVWVPSHFVWTPRGYVFSAGHWDYPLEGRGVLFAPVYFPPALYRRPAFSYTPSIVVNIGDFSASLFVYPRYCHYYFGDFYDDAYLYIGIVPEFEAARLHGLYDPIFRYDRWRFGRAGPGWEQRVPREVAQRRADVSLRPPRTYRDMEIRVARLPEAQRKSFQVAAALSVVARSEPRRFEHVSPAAQQQIIRQATQVRQYREERNRWESAPPAPKSARPGRPAMPGERANPATPAARGIGAPAGEHAPFSPRAVRVTQPERVRIPAAPDVARPADRGAGAKGAGPGPAGERQPNDARGPGNRIR